MDTPEVERLTSISDAQSASQKAFSDKGWARVTRSNVSNHILSFHIKEIIVIV